MKVVKTRDEVDAINTLFLKLFCRRRFPHHTTLILASSSKGNKIKKTRICEYVYCENEKIGREQMEREKTGGKMAPSRLAAFASRKCITCSCGFLLAMNSYTLSLDCCRADCMPHG